MRIAVTGPRVGAIAIAFALLGWSAVRSWLCDPALVAQPDLPPWFGDANRPATRIAGKVHGARQAMTVHLHLDVRDPAHRKYRQVRTSSSGEFDFGPLRAGRFRLFADGHGWLSRVVSVDTMHGAGDRIELFAHEWRTVAARVDVDGQSFRDEDWREARRLSSGAAPPWSWHGPLTTGVVVRADGTPASAVGVQPVQCGGDHSIPRGVDIVATTNAGGGFAFNAPDRTCGLRILMGPTVHEIDGRRDGVPLVINLPPPGREELAISDGYQRAFGDRRGAWLRGRVVRGGVGVADVDLGARVALLDYMEIYDETRSRSDGTFELFVSSLRLHKRPHVVLQARQTLTEHAGVQVVHVRPGETRDDITIDIGAASRISGRVVDENGLPIVGVHVTADPYWRKTWSQPTGSDGSFQIEVGTQGRYHLHVVTTERIEHAPVSGVVRTVDIVKPDADHSGVNVVVRRHERQEIRAELDHGCVNLGVRTSYGTVAAVGDELAAAGLRPGDEIISAQVPGIELECWETKRMPACVPWGQTVVLTVKRGEETIIVRATAPAFDSSLSK